MLLVAIHTAAGLWIGDRNFCTLKLIYETNGRKAAFIIRHHKKLVGRRYVGRVAAGEVACVGGFKPT